MKASARILLTAALFSAAAAVLSAEESEKINLNRYYHWPVSISASYQPLSGIGSRTLADFTITEIAGEARLSFAGLPAIQPLLRGGYIGYAFVGDLEETRQDWSHSHIFGGPGIGYSGRISKEFEIGADLFAGVTYSTFSSLSLSGEALSFGQMNFIAGGSARLILNPSFNISIAVSPSIRYMHDLGELDTYNGFTYGIGFSLSYRFGRDPDTSGGDIRAIRFTGAEMPPVFAAMQSYYTVNPLTVVTITNTDKTAVEELNIGFMQTGYMDSPTPLKAPVRLAPGESAEVPVTAIFNDQIFTTQGITPLTGEIVASYKLKGRSASQVQSVTYELHDKNSLTWDDDRKVAAFITPQDSAVRNYASYIRQVHKDAVNPYLSKNFQFAVQAFNALAELGIMYQVDPTSPYTKVQDDILAIDSISLPRETLTRLSGDCDDLTVLYNTLLQSVGIESAFVTTPGHIYCGFDTGTPVKDFSMLHSDREMFIEIDGKLWVLVEITMIGRNSFPEAWKTGISEYRRYDGEPGQRGFYKTAEAQQIYRSVALRESDLGLQYGDKEKLLNEYKSAMWQLSGFILSPLREQAERTNNAGDWNAYGLAAAKLESYSVAEAAFKNVIELKPDFVSARLNLASLYYLQKNYTKALTAFEDVEKLIQGGSGLRDRGFSLLLNLSKTHYALANYAEAETYFIKARELDRAAAEKHTYMVAETGSDGARALAADEDVPILFVDYEENID